MATAQTTIQTLRQLFARFGIPESIVSDNGTQFTALEFEEFCRLNDIVHTKAAPYHPSSNGLAERAVRVFKQGLRKQNRRKYFRPTISNVIAVQNHAALYDGIITSRVTDGQKVTFETRFAETKD